MFLDTCENGWHVSQPWAKRCDCGEQSNPAYRSRTRRLIDKYKFWRLRRSL